MSAMEIIMQVLRIAIPAVATLLAAFFGAYFAYRLQDKAKMRAERKSNISAANQALFMVFQQVNSLKLYQVDMIDPVRNHPAKFIAMQAVLHEKHEDIQFDFSSLGFLLNTKHKQIVLDLFIEQQRFREAIKAINYRSALHIQQAQPAPGACGNPRGCRLPRRGAEHSPKCLVRGYTSRCNAPPTKSSTMWTARSSRSMRSRRK